jgi:tagaturonate reductase
MSNPILQFGTSRFLQAHVDLFVAQALQCEPSRALGRITVVQSTSNPESRARIDALRASSVYPVRIRGRKGDTTIDETVQCDAITEALNATDDWPTLRERVRHDAQVIVSNTGDTGYVSFNEDIPRGFDGPSVPRGFPAKLAALLHDRFIAGAAPVTLMPCELISDNGATLRDAVLRIAKQWHANDGFIQYLQRDCIWVNSLVDRIVSEPIHPVGAIAEPYALWAVERQPGMILPCEHEDIVITDDLASHERLKLFLLNLGHTMLAELWLAEHSAADATVLDAMRNAAWRDALESVWQEEVLPVFNALGNHDAARAYLVEVRDRFENPFLDHRLADIARNHEEKKRRRFKPVIDLARQSGLNVEQKRLVAALQ